MLVFFYCSYKPVHNADFIVPVEIDGTIHQVCQILVFLLQFFQSCVKT